MLLQGLFFLGFNPVNAQQVVDTTLKNAILRGCNTCLDNNGNVLATARTISSLYLNIGSNTSINTTKGIEGFTNLSTIYINGSEPDSSWNTHKFDSLPENLIRLNLELAYYKKIEKLPSNLVYLSIDSYTDSIFPALPNSLVSIEIDIKNVGNLSKLPNSLRRLHILNAENLRQLPQLSQNLVWLLLENYKSTNRNDTTIKVNTKLTALPILPPSLISLSIIGYTKLTHIPNLPDSLTELYLIIVSLLEKLPTPLPSHLRVLFVVGTKIKCLPILPNSVSDLVIPNTLCLPNIPQSIVRLTIDSTRIQNPANVAICNRNNTCQYPANISGKVYYDTNNNGSQNPNEPNAKTILLKSTDNSLMGLTDTTGSYNLIGDSLKAYTFSPVFSNNYFKVVPLSKTITTTNAIAQRFDSLDFAIQSLGTFPDIALSLTSGNARPGFNSVSTLTYKNVGTTTLNGTITLTLDAKQTFVSADVAPTQNGNILTWNYTNLQPFDFKNINITLKTLVTAPLSSLATSTVNGTITGATDANLLNNSETTQITVRGSYDPNDKQVDKIGIPTVIAIATTPLTYTIRFQNTGNAEAIRVEVVDTLTKKLDITSIEMLGASHPYEMKIVSDSGKVKDFTVVKWTFDDIYLPDSTSNEKGSHGFIKYRIKNDTKKMGLTVDSILNKAAIYFDFNPPIITNQVRTLFSPRVATVELKDLGLNVFPNPVSNVLTINSTNKTEQELTIDVVNMNGQVLIHQILRGQNPQINVQELSMGLYFLKIKTSEGMGIVKIVKQ